MTDNKKLMIDESQKTFSPQEKAIADLLASEGKKVKVLLETNQGRTADAEVDGIPTEFKSLIMGVTNNTLKNQISNSIKRGGQARQIIIDGRNSGLTEAEAKLGLQRAKNISRGRIDKVRIIGDDYDISFTEFQ